MIIVNQEPETATASGTNAGIEGTASNSANIIVEKENQVRENIL